MNKPEIPESFLEIIFAHAKKAYPSECCGIILGPAGKPGYSRVKSYRNIQDEYHQQDPQNFPRTSRNAYFIDPEELLTLQKEMRVQKEEMKIIYHSHIDADAYFSEEDQRRALWEEDPVYPGVDYLVISVLQTKVQDWKFYRWHSQTQTFEIVPSESNGKL